MGYSTTFNGELKFNRELTSEEKQVVAAMFDEDCRDHPEWNAGGLSYIDLEFNEDETGLKWNGAEKTYCLNELVNVLIREVRKTVPDFGLTGSMSAQGEIGSDQWILLIGGDGWAAKKDIPKASDDIKCPHCGHAFALGSALI